jgi:predicted type IV restriction endonuclease
MDFVDQVKSLAARTPNQLEHIKTEAATRNALIEPFIRALGYDTSDLTEVVPEFGADLDVPGVAKNKKVDYGILKDGKPIILIECKHYTDKLNEGFKQLFHYAVATDCRFGILTNGLVYRFYADLDKPSKLDESPFLELDMLNLKEAALEELKCLTKAALDVDGMLTAASELKYVGGMLRILTEQLDAPSDEFSKFFFQQLCPGKPFAGSIKPMFVSFTQRALRQFVRDRVNSLMDASGMGSSGSTASAAVAAPVAEVVDDPVGKSSQVVTTEEEMEAFYLVKSILRDVVDPKRIAYRDVVSYFSVLLDDNNRKPICRLYLNNPQSKRLGLFGVGDERQEEKFSIDRLDDIYRFSDRLRATVARYGV